MSDITSLESELINALAQLDEDRVYDLVRKTLTAAPHPNRS